MAETSEIHVGTVLGETYEITELLGAGGMGAVWAAKHLRLPGKRVAVKVLHGVAAGGSSAGGVGSRAAAPSGTPASIDREAYARFRREAEIASRIGHPNIVTVHDFNVLASGTPYLVLELLDGEDLAQRLARGPLPAAAALAIARQIGSALHAAHKADVVHRDLKPGNIFLTRTEIGGELVDQVKVLDFGISKIRGSQTVQTQDAVLLGTPQYMAPEQALGKNADIDARTDIFALGAIVYEMLSGRPAFMGSTLAEVVFKVVYDAPAPLGELAAGVPNNVVAAVEQALAKDPAQRFADVAAFINALTGRPLQTLDRQRATSPAPEGFASTDPGLGLAATAAAAAPPATTGARGELSPVIPPTRGARSGSDGKKAAFLAGAILAAVGGTIGVMKLTQRPDAAPPPKLESPQIEAVSKPAKIEMPAAEQAATPTADMAATPTADKAATPATDKAATPATDKAATAKSEKGATAAARQSDKSDALPPAVAADLATAERLIASNGGEAIRLARRTLVTAKTSRAFSVIARAYCHEGNLGDAKAALHSVSRAERGRVLKYCKSVGTELQ
jgi:serine/threonine-protein kinase